MQCPTCHSLLADDAPIYRVSLSLYQENRVIQHRCDSCLVRHSHNVAGRWREPVTCHGCGRPMVFDTIRAIPEMVACGLDCRRIISAAKARERRARRRRERHCGDCGGLFMPKRTDARFCSPACRLRAHRRRQHAEAASSSAPTARSAPRKRKPAAAVPGPSAMASRSSGTATLLVRVLDSGRRRGLY